MNGVKNNAAKAWGLLAALLLTNGCATYNASYQTNMRGGGQVHEEKAAYFVYGLVGDKTLDLSTLCPSGVARVSSKHTFVDNLLTGLTVGLYAPMTIEVECAGGRSYLLTPHQQDAVTEVEPLG